jgi:uncharacterized membrane protein YvlD (DUF360 family)
MDSSPFTIVILPILTVIAVALLGSTRRIGFWFALFLAIVLTPVGGLIAALISGPKRSTLRSRKKPIKKP